MFEHGKAMDVLKGGGDCGQHNVYSPMMEITPLGGILGQRNGTVVLLIQIGPRGTSKLYPAKCFCGNQTVDVTCGFALRLCLLSFIAF